MKCFNHSSISALGTCKACGKGLCNYCLTDLEHGLACKDKHEERVKSLELIISQSAKAYADSPKNIFLLPAFLVFMGLIFVSFALFEGKSFVSFPVVMGAGFVFFGVLFFIRMRKVYLSKANKVSHD